MIETNNENNMVSIEKRKIAKRKKPSNTLTCLLLIISFILGFTIDKLCTINGHLYYYATTTSYNIFDNSPIITHRNTHNDPHNCNDNHNNNNNNNGWCPKNSECHNTNTTTTTTSTKSTSNTCNPCKQQFLILFTSSRSASTTLTWMLDKLPGIHMGGENNDLLTKLHNLYNQVLKQQQFVGGTNKRGYNAWGHNPINPNEFHCLSQSFIKNINPPSITSEDNNNEDNGSSSSSLVGSQKEDEKDYDESSSLSSNHLIILGFKTVRFINYETTEWQLYNKMKFVQQHFPCSRIVVNINTDIQQRYESMKTHFKKFNNNMTTPEKIVEINLKYKMLYDMFNNNKKYNKNIHDDGHDNDSSDNGNNEAAKGTTNNNPNENDAAFLLDKKEWTKNITKLNELVSWLGYSKGCYFTELLQLNTNGTGFQHMKTELLNGFDKKSSSSSTNNNNNNKCQRILL